MTFLVFIIAITNLGLGYVCGWVAIRANAGVMAAEASMPVARVTTGGALQPQPATAAVAVEAPPVPEAGTPKEPSPTTTQQDTPPQAPPAKQAEPPKSWDDFTAQLRQVRERLDYARSIEDRRLASEVGGQLQTCAQSWFGHLEKTLEAALSGEGDAPTEEAADTMQLEMCLAQFETTLGNLQSFDWKAEPTVVFTKLQKETEALEACQKLAGLTTAS